MKELTLALSNSSSSSSSFAHDSSFTFKWTYDVFLNFRGEDTRNGFTGHLYHALLVRGIHTFIDDRLERGEEITPALLEAIDKSRIAIVILSVNYVSSSFCLEELVKIFECTKQKNRLILPIFYKVEPSDVRHLRGSYQEALVRHETQHNKEKVHNWKSALRDVANLSGWHFKEGHGYEYEFVKKIVEEVCNKIKQTPLYVAKYPVGLKSRVEEVISLLDLGSNKEKIMVGIHGIGGIGKTTIASAVYNVIVDQFEGACFLSDVRERSYKHGLVELQETLLFELTAEKGIKVENVRKGVLMIRRRLCQKKVLLILDDVNSQEQLEAIAGGVDWFGFGSRIIMTTRDKHLLDVLAVKRHYEVKELCFEEALELFRWNAFKQNEVDSRYTSITIRITSYCSGLPLALEIIGSNLFGKTQEEWKSALDTYEKFPNKDVQNSLKLSYTSLEENEKEIFLDIACFFNGYYLGHVKSILQNGRGYDPQYGIGVLEKKSLIRINYGLVKIHDLIVQMGREIVRSQSPSNPGNWSRLWSYEDILSVLEEDKGSNKIEFLMLNMPQRKKVQWNGKAFKKMKNLKILIIKNACFSRDSKYLPNSLRVLEWENYSSSALPSNFHPRNLVTLNLCKSSLKFVKVLKNFESLTKMNLSGSQFLKQVADISEAVNLKVLDISGCENLIEVHHSVGSLDKLKVLDAYGCTKLSTFPCSIKSASLTLLNLTHCFSLQSVPELPGMYVHLPTCYWPGSISISRAGSLRLYENGGRLFIECGISMLPTLEKWIDGFQEKASPVIPVHLTIYPLDFEEQLHHFPTLELDYESKFFSACHPYYSSLTDLHLRYIHSLADELCQRLPCFPNLVVLDLSYNRFTVLPECMNRCYHLRSLRLRGCKDLREIRGIPPNIRSCFTVNCTLLTSQSSKILLSQAFHEDRGSRFIVPGFKIPTWLEHRCMGSQISFWCRDEFPRLLLCLVSYDSRVQICCTINGIKFHPYPHGIDSWSSYTTCILLEDFHHWGKILEKELKKDEWNHVVISHGQNIIDMAVHVYKEDTGMDNVRFIDSNPLRQKWIINHNWDLISGFSLQNKFCPSLDMRVCVPLYSHKEAKTLSRIKSEEMLFPIKSEEMAIRNMPFSMFCSNAPTKVKVLVWRILENSSPLPTCCDLFRRKLVKSPLCPICETEFETIEHAFFECSWTIPLWFGSGLGWTIKDRWVPPNELKKHDYKSASQVIWLEQKFQYIMKVHPNGKSVIGLMGNILWTIWKARNEFVLGNKPVNPLEALLIAKAMHMQYSFEASTSTIHSENVKGTKAENKVKPKRKNVSNINTEVEPTCDKGIEAEDKAKQRRNRASNKLENKVNRRRKEVSNTNKKAINDKGTQVENKTKWKRKAVSNDPEVEPDCEKGTQVENMAKRKKGGESNNNTKRDPNCEKGLAIPIDIPSVVRDEENIASKAEENQKPYEEVNQMFRNEKEDEQPAKKGKYQRRSQSDVASNEPTEPSPSNISSHDSQTEHKTRTKQPKTTTVLIPPDHSNQNIIEKSHEPVASKEISVNETTLGSKPQTTISEMNKEAEVELPSDFDSSQRNIEVKKLEVQQLEHSKAMSEDEEDPIAALTSLILADEEISTSNDSKSETTSQPYAKRRAKIKQAILALDSILDDDLEMFLKDCEKRESMKSVLETLQDTTEDEVAVGLKSFVLQLGQQLPSMLECMDKTLTIEEAYQSLASRKKELATFSKSTGTRKEQLDEDRQVCMQNVETNSQQILATMVKIEELEKELKQLKATQLNLEGAMKAIDLEDQMLKQQAKNAINDFKATSSKMVNMEVERKTMNVAKTQTLVKWKDFKGIFKKMVDSL